MDGCGLTFRITGRRQAVRVDAVVGRLVVKHEDVEMLDANEAKITKTGTVTVDTDGQCRVWVEGFQGNNCSCRDVAALAMAWAIGELQRELVATLQRPGGGSCGVGAPRTPNV